MLENMIVVGNTLTVVAIVMSIASWNKSLNYSKPYRFMVGLAYLTMGTSWLVVAVNDVGGARFFWEMALFVVGYSSGLGYFWTMDQEPPADKTATEPTAEKQPAE